MKSAFYLFLVTISFVGQTSFAADNACQQNFGLDVSACAKSIQTLAPADIPGAQKSCLESAKAAKEACLAGTNQCLTTCQTNLSNSQATCQTEYNTTVGQCGGEPFCVSLITQVLNSCLSTAQSTYDSCALGCQ